MARRMKKVIGGGFSQRKSLYHRFIGAIANTAEPIRALRCEVNLRDIRKTRMTDATSNDTSGNAIVQGGKEDRANGVKRYRKRGGYAYWKSRYGIFPAVKLDTRGTYASLKS